MTTDRLISELGSQLTPSPSRRPIWQITLLWLTVSAAYVAATMLVLGPFRPGSLLQLAEHPRFALENAFGAGAIVFFALSAFFGSVPGMATRWCRILGVTFLALWLADFVFGYVSPALDPSMFGKRGHCALEAYLYSVPPTLAAIWIQARRYPLEPVRIAVHAALAAGMIPAVLMQLACMYAPTHILQHHALPVAVVAVVTGAVVYGLGRWPLFRRITR